MQEQEQYLCVIFLADKLSVVYHIELLPREQLLLADEAGEALEVEDLVPGLPHEVLGADAEPAATALGPEPPERKVGSGGAGRKDQENSQ